MKILFVKESQSYPRSSGHDVHGFHMMKQLGELGHSIGLLTSTPTLAQAVEGVDLVYNQRFSDLEKPEQVASLGGLQGKFVSYWGIDPQRPHQIAELVKRESFDAVVVVGLHVLPYLSCVKGAIRVWYAADEWLWHHWSQFRFLRRDTWGELKQGLVKGLYERAFNSTTDRVWAVSKNDQVAFRWVMGAGKIDIVPNGVDAEYYCPIEVNKIPKSCVFWGRLDFGPNLDAIGWFGENVWAKVSQKHPDAVWKVFGFGAGDQVRTLKSRYGFELITDLPDLREQVQNCQIVVLPFVSGGGIKNKLLEAAAMELPIIASKKAMNGIDSGHSPILIRHKPLDWVRTLEGLWSSPEELNRLAIEHRKWVSGFYSWSSAAWVADRALSGSH